MSSTLVPVASEARVSQEAVAPSDRLQRSLQTATKPFEDDLDAYHQFLLDGGNVGIQIVHLQNHLEKVQEEKIKKGLEKNEAIMGKVRTVNRFLQCLQTALSNHTATTMNLSHESELVEKVNELIPHELFRRTNWSREEASAISKTLSSKADQLLNQSNEILRKVSQEGDRYNELLPLFRDLAKVWDHMHQVFVRNQRA